MTLHYNKRELVTVHHHLKYLRLNFNCKCFFTWSDCDCDCKLRQKLSHNDPLSCYDGLTATVAVHRSSLSQWVLYPFCMTGICDTVIVAPITVADAPCEPALTSRNRMCLSNLFSCLRY